MKWVLNWTVFQFSQHCYWIFPFLFDLWFSFLPKCTVFENLLCGKHCCVALSILYELPHFSSQQPCAQRILTCTVLSLCYHFYVGLSSFLFLCHYHSVLILFFFGLNSYICVSLSRKAKVPLLFLPFSILACLSFQMNLSVLCRVPEGISLECFSGSA